MSDGYPIDEMAPATCALHFEGKRLTRFPVRGEKIVTVAIDNVRDGDYVRVPLDYYVGTINKFITYFEFEVEIGDLIIADRYIDLCDAEVLTQTFFGKRRVNSLYFSRCAFRPFALQSLVPTILHERVSYLTFADNYDAVGGNDVYQSDLNLLFRLISIPGNALIDLTLNQNQLSHETRVNLFRACCSENSRLASLCVGETGLDDARLAGVCEFITNPNFTVRILNLWDNMLSETGVNVLHAALAHPDCKVTTCDMEQVGARAAIERRKNNHRVVAAG